MKITDVVGVKPKVFKPDSSRWPDLFGVELELENVDNVRNIPYWQVKEDASLRNGVEFVTEAPFASDTLEAAINEFYNAKFTWKNSPRTSTHIHVNVTDCDVSVVQSMAVIMYAIEDALYNAIGASRKWSGYSVSLDEMEPQRLRDLFSVEKGKLARALNPGRNQERYYGFNFYVSKHGTVEFRYFPGGPSKAELESWIDLVYAVKRIGMKYEPTQLVERIAYREDLEDFIAREFPNAWIGKLFKHGDAETMYRKFVEVAAFVVAGEQMERREPLVFLTVPFVRYLGKNLLKEAGVKYIEQIRDGIGAMTQGEWLYHLEQAQTIDGMAPKQKVANKLRPFPVDAELGQLAEAPQDYGAFDIEANNPPQPVVQADAPAPRLAGQVNVDRPDNAFVWQEYGNARAPWDVNPFEVQAPNAEVLREQRIQQQRELFRQQQNQAQALEAARLQRDRLRRELGRVRNPFADDNGDF